MSLMNQARAECERVFGFSSFRAGQEEIIHASLLSRDVLGVLPTGAGKSLCYQLPAIVSTKTTLVVSPLIALMNDQAQALQRKGITAAALHSGMLHNDVQLALYQALLGKMRILFVSPERLQSASFLQQLEPIAIERLVIDEAHCISEWGHDFRPAYKTINIFFEHYPRIPILAVTATATPDVRKDIVTSLGMKNVVEVVRGFNRPNLQFAVQNTSAKIETVTQWAKKNASETAIVYAGSRRRVDSVAEALVRRGIEAEGYHAGKSLQDRNAIQERFVQNSSRVLVATSAFGMGVDKPNVRSVFHTDLTLTLEAYYQEAGRAGRDGLAAQCVVLYQADDKNLMEFFLQCTFPEQRFVFQVYNYLWFRAGLGKGASSQNPLLVDERSIAAEIHSSVAQVSGAIQLLEQSGIIARTNSLGTANVYVTCTPEEFANATMFAPASRKPIMEVLLRLLGGFGTSQRIVLNLYELQRQHGLTAVEVAESMKALQLANLVRYLPAESNNGITLLLPNMEVQELPIDWDVLHRRREHAYQKLQVMIRYATDPVCKRGYILRYFDDPEAPQHCDNCSSCLQPAVPQNLSERERTLIQLLVSAAHQTQGMFGRNILADVISGALTQKVEQYQLQRCVSWNTTKAARGEIMNALDTAIVMGYITRSADLYPVVKATEQGVALLKHVPKPLSKKQVPIPEHQGVNQQVVNALRAWLHRTAERLHVAESSIMSATELQNLATDQPTSLKEIIPGRHGSGLMLARYGAEIVREILKYSETKLNPAIDSEAQRVLSNIRAHSTLEDVAKECKISMAMCAQILQRCIELGVLVNVGKLVPDWLYTDVLQFVRNHRYAKLRHVREEVSQDAELPVLRVTLAFVRHQLYSEVS